MPTSLLQDADPPRLFRGLQVDPEEARSILRFQRDAVYGFNFSLNPYRGCSHGCQYCYVREYPAAAPKMGQGALHDPADWGRWIAPKLNAPELLWGQRHKLHGQTVFMSGATDPYQPIERDFRLSRKCLEVLLRCPTTRVIVHTRSPLVLQDLALLQAFGERLSVGFSVPTDDDAVRQVVEPEAPSIASRWATMARLSEAAIRVSLSAAPLMAIRDIQGFARHARAVGARGGWAGGLRLLPKDPFHEVLRAHGWLHILSKAYVAEVKEALARTLPPRADRVARPRPLKGLPYRGPGHQAPPLLLA